MRVMGKIMLEVKETFIKQILKNLQLNGYPNKKVSFDIFKMYELADNKELSFNAILEDLEKVHNVLHEKTAEKVIFYSDVDNNMNKDMYEQAKDVLSKMSPDEISKMKQMYENMSDDEKNNILEQAKKMGLMG